MISFEILWKMVEKHGGVAEFYKTDCARLWDTYTPDQQEAIYRSIRDKLKAGRFVHYNPLRAIKENEPRPPKEQILPFEEYYALFGTTEEQGGWVRRFLPEQQKTIFVKTNK